MVYEETESPENGSPPVPNPEGGIGTRIAEISERLGGRKNASRAAGVAMSTFHRWIAGDSVPALDSISRLARAANVSLDWIATGQAEGEEQERSPRYQAEGLQANNLPEGVRIEDYTFIPLYDAQCSAGHGAWNEGCQILTHISFTRYSLRKQGLTPEHLSAIRVDGESMEPILHSGDTVLIDHTRTNVEGEGIYVLRLDGHLYAKKLQRQLDGVAIISANKEYREIVVPQNRLAELEIVGRAVWAAGWL